MFFIHWQQFVLCRTPTSALTVLLVCRVSTVQFQKTVSGGVCLSWPTNLPSHKSPCLRMVCHGLNGGDPALWPTWSSSPSCGASVSTAHRSNRDSSGTIRGPKENPFTTRKPEKRLTRHKNLDQTPRPTTFPLYSSVSRRFVVGATVACGEVRLQLSAAFTALDATQQRLKSQTSFFVCFLQMIALDTQQRGGFKANMRRQRHGQQDRLKRRQHARSSTMSLHMEATILVPGSLHEVPRRQVRQQVGGTSSERFGKHLLCTNDAREADTNTLLHDT